MRIDAHHHVWDPSRGNHGWPAPADGALYRAFRPDDLAPLIAAAGIAGTIVVQAAASVAETDDLLTLARATPWMLGVVGWIDLAAPDIVAQIATRGADPLFVGVRPMLQDMTNRRWILDPRNGAALQALAAAGLSFDALIRADQLGVIAELAARHPDLRIILDHAAKPAITAAGPDAAWAEGIVRLAVHGNVACKLSGLLTEAPPGADAAMLAPYIEILHDAFGDDRLSWGSDWPVLTLAGEYACWHAMAAALVPVKDHDAVFGGTARRIYALETGI